MITACLADCPPLTLEIQRAPDGLWVMQLFDHRAACKVILPPSEFGLDAAKQKALINARYYMRKFGGDPSWIAPATIEWHEFSAREIIWET